MFVIGYPTIIIVSLIVILTNLFIFKCMRAYLNNIAARSAKIIFMAGYNMGAGTLYGHVVNAGYKVLYDSEGRITGIESECQKGVDNEVDN